MVVLVAMEEEVIASHPMICVVGEEEDEDDQWNCVSMVFLSWKIGYNVADDPDDGGGEHDGCGKSCPLFSSYCYRPFLFSSEWQWQALTFPSSSLDYCFCALYNVRDFSVLYHVN